jgi:catechol 2,3-dioxygenase-like lactoylglutathione lyase family enzyme
MLAAEELALTVPDLGEATGFFASVFGAEVLSEGGRVEDHRGSSMRAFFNSDVRAEIRATRLLRTPFLNLQLIEAAYPGQRRIWPGMLDVGGWHLAAYVDDIDAAIEVLESSDVYILGPGKKPTTNPPEVGEGSYACHCMTSWGFHFELLTYPKGRAYMADFDRRLWNPAEPDAGATRRAPAAGALPGFRGFEHISFAVPDVAEASSFFESALACERFYDMGPVSDPHGSGFGAYANVDVRVEVPTVRLFRTTYLNLELIEPTFPGQNRAWPGLLDIGGWKISFSVDDIGAVVPGLLAAGAHLLGEPRRETGGACGGTRLRQSCLVPFGFYFDLVQDDPYAPGPAPEGAAAWHPSRPHL